MSYTAAVCTSAAYLQAEPPHCSPRPHLRIMHSTSLSSTQHLTRRTQTSDQIAIVCDNQPCCGHNALHSLPASLQQDRPQVAWQQQQCTLSLMCDSVPAPRLAHYPTPAPPVSLAVPHHTTPNHMAAVRSAPPHCVNKLWPSSHTPTHGWRAAELELSPPLPPFCPTLSVGGLKGSPHSSHALRHGALGANTCRATTTAAATASFTAAAGSSALPCACCSRATTRL